ncbi:hypothetical protein THAOC_36669, partial [Thalassiosira oceanica]
GHERGVVVGGGLDEEPRTQEGRRRREQRRLGRERLVVALPATREKEGSRQGHCRWREDGRREEADGGGAARLHTREGGGPRQARQAVLWLGRRRAVLEKGRRRESAAEAVALGGTDQRSSGGSGDSGD